MFYSYMEQQRRSSGKEGKQEVRSSMLEQSRYETRARVLPVLAKFAVHRTRL